MNANPQDRAAIAAIYRRYVELGAIARDAGAERDQIRKTDIEPLILAGEVVGENGRALRRTYEARASFDWQRAVADGAISDELLSRYGSISVTPYLRDAKIGDDQAEDEAKVNLLRAQAPQMMMRLAAAIGALSEGSPAEAQDVLTLALIEAGGDDVVAVLKNSASKGGKR